MLVVMSGVVVHDRAQMPWPGDQHPVGDLSAGGADPALGIGVRLSELTGPVADQEPEPRYPRPSSSPLIRLYPQPGFSRAICSISTTSLASTGGRPPLGG